ncbi:M23 family metallopeptidase [Gleimia hominis]|uniref:M23 family metallopeptidase n=1 Tax=Gleimia hominis TaxID=595468 RepID=UPI0013042CA3|nr:M23 family metallopeptidase [Gleimia hominis]WIK65306.1 M23 family metallopeptidase [Gleimia hominis]
MLHLHRPLPHSLRFAAFSSRALIRSVALVVALALCTGANSVSSSANRETAEWESTGLTITGESADEGPGATRTHPRLKASGRWIPPVPRPLNVGRRFDPPAKRWLPGHRGVDLCPPLGTAVRAPRAGRVVYAADLAGRPVISIEHEDGLHSTLEPVEATVSKGQTVEQGTVVGTLVSGHDNDCLHFGVRKDKDTYLDPLLLINPRAVLKPWDAPA